MGYRFSLGFVQSTRMGAFIRACQTDTLFYQMKGEKMKSLTLSKEKNRAYFYLIRKLIGVVLIWRGMWFLLDAFFLPSDPTLSAVLGIALGVGILYNKDDFSNEL